MVDMLAQPQVFSTSVLPSVLFFYALTGIPRTHPCGSQQNRGGSHHHARFPKQRNDDVLGRYRRRQCLPSSPIRPCWGKSWFESIRCLQGAQWTRHGSTLPSSRWTGRLLRLVFDVFGGLDRETVESEVSNQYRRAATPLAINELGKLDEREGRGYSRVTRICRRTNLLVRRGRRLRLRCQVAPSPSRGVRYC